MNGNKKKMKERKESQQTNYARHRIGVPATMLSPHFSAQACCVCILGILIKLAIRRSFLFFFLLVRSPTLPASTFHLRFARWRANAIIIIRKLLYFPASIIQLHFCTGTAGAGAVSLSVSRRCCHLWTCEICVLLVKRSKSLYPYGNGIPITSKWWLIVRLKENVWEKNGRNEEEIKTNEPHTENGQKVPISYGILVATSEQR